MKTFDKREKILAGSTAILLTLIIFGATQIPQGTNTDQGNWQEVELNDVNSGETFTISELDKPLLVETFAVWCPTCTNQQNEIKKLHNESNITSVSLDVDPNEDEQQIRRHTEENGFDWRYAISPSKLTRMLVNEYGTTVANPPSAPVILVCDNSTRRLDNGVKSSSRLQSEVEKGCQ